MDRAGDLPGKITITKPEMTRFCVNMDQAIDFIFASMNYAKGSEIFVPRLKSYLVKDLAAAFLSATSRNIAVETKGVRVGEKDNELLFNEHEVKYAREVQFGDVISTPDIGQLE